MWRHYRIRASARKVQAIVRDAARTPLQEAADWIEYAIRHDGADFLRLPVMPWYQSYCLDVGALLAAVLLLVIWGLVRLARFLACAAVRKVTGQPTRSKDKSS